ncbi:DNA-binding domain-containing protein [Halobacteriovorax sp. JY17]|uniref:HvfC/BufC N-terminal domain-containing protein n=1 Tax=Halobacteriovorax sp. JY17 TaxID=2014617 RepID=UPI0025C6B903|nr:DNA-binding domain-containing protein [Halobacteriovorax sp. JY17]
MIKLKDFQEIFIKSVQSGDNSLEGLIVPGGSLSKTEAVKVYSGDYYARLQDALGENYEAVWTVVGDDDFYSIGQEYIRKYPSELRDLTSYGEIFPDFLESLEIIDDYPFLRELALFEKEFWTIFHCERESFEVDWEKYLQDFSTLEFEFSKNLRIFKWNYRVNDIFQYRTTGFTDPDFDYDNPQSIMLYKGGANNTVKEITEENFLIIQELMNGKNLEEVIDTLDINLKEEDIQSTFSLLQQSRVFFPKKKNDEL